MLRLKQHTSTKSGLVGWCGMSGLEIFGVAERIYILYRTDMIQLILCYIVLNKKCIIIWLICICIYIYIYIHVKHLDNGGGHGVQSLRAACWSAGCLAALIWAVIFIPIPLPRKVMRTPYSTHVLFECSTNWFGHGHGYRKTSCGLGTKQGLRPFSSWSTAFLHGCLPARLPASGRLPLAASPPPE